MNEQLISYDSVVFDKEKKMFTILEGTKGTYSYTDIKKCSIQCEDAKYRGKTPPFTHTVLAGVTMVILMMEPSIYVGLKIQMKDDQLLAIYTSKEKTRMNTDLYKKDKEEAEKIKHLIDRIIDKYGNN